MDQSSRLSSNPTSSAEAGNTASNSHKAKNDSTNLVADRMELLSGLSNIIQKEESFLEMEMEGNEVGITNLDEKNARIRGTNNYLQKYAEAVEPGIPTGPLGAQICQKRPMSRLEPALLSSAGDTNGLPKNPSADRKAQYSDGSCKSGIIRTQSSANFHGIAGGREFPDRHLQKPDIQSERSILGPSAICQESCHVAGTQVAGRRESVDDHGSRQLLGTETRSLATRARNCCPATAIGRRENGFDHVYGAVDMDMMEVILEILPDVQITRRRRERELILMPLDLRRGTTGPEVKAHNVLPEGKILPSTTQAGEPVQPVELASSSSTSTSSSTEEERQSASFGNLVTSPESWDYPPGATNLIESPSVTNQDSQSKWGFRLPPVGSLSSTLQSSSISSTKPSLTDATEELQRSCMNPNWIEEPHENTPHRSGIPSERVRLPSLPSLSSSSSTASEETSMTDLLEELLCTTTVEQKTKWNSTFPEQQPNTFEANLEQRTTSKARLELQKSALQADSAPGSDTTSPRTTTTTTRESSGQRQSRSYPFRVPRVLEALPPPMSSPPPTSPMLPPRLASVGEYPQYIFPWAPQSADEPKSGATSLACSSSSADAGGTPWVDTREIPYVFNHFLGRFYWRHEDVALDHRWNMWARPPCLQCLLAGEAVARACDRWARQEASFGWVRACARCQRHDVYGSPIPSWKPARCCVEMVEIRDDGRVGYDVRDVRADLYAATVLEIANAIRNISWGATELGLRGEGRVWWRPINLHVGDVEEKKRVVREWEDQGKMWGRCVEQRRWEEQRKWRRAMVMRLYAQWCEEDLEEEPKNVMARLEKEAVHRQENVEKEQEKESLYWRDVILDARRVTYEQDLLDVGQEVADLFEDSWLRVRDDVLRQLPDLVQNRIRVREMKLSPDAAQERLRSSIGDGERLSWLVTLVPQIFHV